MNILWNPNPLATVIELDERDRKILRLGLENDYLLECVVGARMEIEPGSAEFIGRLWRERKGRDRTIDDSVAEALARLTFTDESMAEHIDMQMGYSVTALVEAHDGDCTCVPCSCTKCRAEGLLGVNTIAGLGKHEAAKVGGAFKVTGSLNGAIERLANWQPSKPGPGWERHPAGAYESHIPRWTEEAKSAHAWLVQYRAEHFS